MERRFKLLILLFISLVVVSAFTVAAPIFGLSTVLGVSVLGSSVLGSSVLGSSVLGSSVLGSSVLGTTIVEAYSGAIATSQIGLSLIAIGLLMYLQLTDPAHGRLKRVLVELRTSWLSVSALIVFLFFIIVALKVWNILV